MQTSRFRCSAASLFVVFFLVTTPGCYSYTYRLRSQVGVDHQEIAIENSPHEDVRWSSWWGGSQDKWSPIEEVKDASGKVVQVPYCDHGLGQVTVEYTAGTFLMTIFTLGMAVPMSVSAWCSTEPPQSSGPHTGP